MPGITLQQLTTVPQILRVYKKLYKPSNFFQRMFRIGPTDPASMVSALPTAGYDTYAATRTQAPVTARMAPPPRVGRKPIGTQVVTLARLHAAITIADEEVYRGRPLGGPIGSVDPMGQKYVKMQIDHLRTMFDNSIEFMIAKMFQGGWSLDTDGGDQYRLTDYDTNKIISNSYSIPSENTGNAGGIIDALWNITTTDILTQLNKLSAQSARTSGLLPKHVFLNGITAAPLFNNTKLNAVGGTAYRIFDSISNREVSGDNAPTSGAYDVVFRALPQYVFHIYNEGYVANEVVPDFDSQTSLTNFVRYIPDGRAIVTPDPGDWIGSIVGQEPVAENVNDPGRIVTGFHLWKTREIDPPRYDIKAVHNFAPILPIPSAIYYLTVG